MRGIAIFFVLMNHVNIRLLINKVPYRQYIPKQLIGPLVWNGQNGVQIFFAISGFLIASMTLRRWGSLSRVRLRDFYLFRFARIAPLLLLLLAILSVLHLAGWPAYVISPARGGLGRALLAALTFHINVLEASKGYLPPSWDILWSLSVEEVFYLGFPLACVFLSRGKLLPLVLSAFVVIGPFARVFAQKEIWREYSYLGSMDAIASGCLTAIFLNHRTLTDRTRLALKSGGAALMIFTLGFPILAANWGIERVGLDMTILAVGTCMVIASTARNTRSSPAILSPLRWLGQRSYEVYLTHVFVVLGLLSVFLGAGKPLSGVAPYFVATVIFSGILGELVARFYSEPMNRLLRTRVRSGS